MITMIAIQPIMVPFPGPIHVVLPLPTLYDWQPLKMRIVVVTVVMSRIMAKKQAIVCDNRHDSVVVLHRSLFVE